MSKLRSALEPERKGQGTVVVSTPVGYQLDSTAVIDVHEFERMVHEASNLLANDPTASALKGRAGASRRSSPISPSSHRWPQRFALLSRPGRVSGSTPDSWCARTLRAAAHLRLAQPTQAAEALEGVVRAIGTQPEPNGYGVPVGFLAGVAALDLGDAEAAAQWFGHAAAESERLEIQLRPSDVDLVAEARTRCQDTLGNDRFDQLATAGAATRLADLPAILNRLNRTLHSQPTA